MPQKERVIRLRWNHPQGEFLRAREMFVDLEGAIRSGKTTPAVWKVYDYVEQYPGIICFIGRWTQDALDAQLRPQFYEKLPHESMGCPPDCRKPTKTGWHADEEFQHFRNGSKVYIRALKTADETSRYAKIAGLTLAIIYIDQPEEMPEDIHHALVGRLSQPGFPHQLLYTPNPPSPDHWLTREFPEDNSREDHRYIVTSVYDNRRNLGDRYIDMLEREYPLGHVMRRRFIDGQRGLSLVGEAVYGAHLFKRALHVRDLEPVIDMPLLESYDFGHKHPAVLWSQLLPWGEWRILGEFLGDRQYIEDFVPLVIAKRAQLFPGVQEVWACCDPAGADENSQGTKMNGVRVLQDHNIFARWIPGSNKADRRDYAIQTIAGFMRQLTTNGPALQSHSRCTILNDGFEAGYVWDERKAGAPQMLPNIRRPKKDGYYDHLQNTAEYTILNFAVGTPVVQQKARRDAQQLQNAQRDHDPDDVVRRAREISRGGYGH